MRKFSFSLTQKAAFHSTFIWGCILSLCMVYSATFSQVFPSVNFGILLLISPSSEQDTAKH